MAGQQQAASGAQHQAPSTRVKATRRRVHSQPRRIGEFRLPALCQQTPSPLRSIASSMPDNSISLRAPSIWVERSGTAGDHRQRASEVGRERWPSSCPARRTVRLHVDHAPASARLHGVWLARNSGRPSATANPTASRPAGASRVDGVASSIGEAGSAAH